MPQKPNPACNGCRHAFSLHRRGLGHCHAMGCKCRAWRGRNPDLPPWLSKSLTVAQVATKIGRSESFVKAHAEDLGGRRIHTQFLGQSGDTFVWRFNPRVVEQPIAV